MVLETMYIDVIFQEGKLTQEVFKCMPFHIAIPPIGIYIKVN